MKKLKKVLLSLMAAAISATSLCSVIPASAATGKYNAYSYYFDVGENVCVQKLSASMSYNPSNTAYVRSGNGNLGGYFNVTVTSNTISVNYSNSAPVSAAGYLGFVTIKTTATPPPSFVISQVTNATGTSISTSNVTVSRILMGDVNLDGSVTQEDAELVNRAVLGKTTLNTTQQRAADVNGNGTVDATDSLNILKYVNGVIDCVVV